MRKEDASVISCGDIMTLSHKLPILYIVVIYIYSRK